jgi:RNA polymerase sigma-70 factor (ECF subfamily)
MATTLSEGLALIDRIDGLEGYHLLHAARADLLRRLDRADEAVAAYRRAHELATTPLTSASSPVASAPSKNRKLDVMSCREAGRPFVLW